MALSEFQDPYVDQQSGVLRNLIGAASQSSLNDAACRTAAEDRDLGPLTEMFDGIVSDSP